MTLKKVGVLVQRGNVKIRDVITSKPKWTTNVTNGKVFKTIYIKYILTHKPMFSVIVTSLLSPNPL